MLHRLSVYRGVTLVEIAVVLALVAILTGYAVPAFHRLLLDSRRNASVVTTVHAVNLARQLAAIRGGAVRLCGGADSQHCTGRTDWTSGLLVMDDADSLHRHLPLSAQGHLISVRANRNDIAFEGGSGFATPATVTICDRRGSRAARAIIISRSGRPRVSATDSSGRPLSC